MVSRQKVLGDPPADARRRELWLQHGAGLIVFEDVRGYARKLIEPNLGDEARGAALKAIDDAVYGLMMVIDGVTGDLHGRGRMLSLRTTVRLERSDTGEVIDALDLAEGDGMCMGYHGWVNGDFGDDPVVQSAGRSGSPEEA
jgi:hypothetical protein